MNLYSLYFLGASGCSQMSIKCGQNPRLKWAKTM